MTSIIDKQFTDWYNEAAKAYREDRLQDCIDIGKQILQDTACPLYHRMKILVLVGNVLGDWKEANEYCKRVEVLWRTTRRWNPPGEDESVEAAFQELRNLIDDLREALDEDEAKDNKPDYGSDSYEDDVEDAMAANDARTEEARDVWTAKYGPEIEYAKQVEVEEQKALAEARRFVEEGKGNGKGAEEEQGLESKGKLPISAIVLPDRTGSPSMASKPEIGPAQFTFSSPSMALKREVEPAQSALGGLSMALKRDVEPAQSTLGGPSITLKREIEPAQSTSSYRSENPADRKLRNKRSAYLRTIDWRKKNEETDS